MRRWMMEKFEVTDRIKLGQSVKDKVSGLKGIVSSKLESVTGNVQFGVQPKGDGADVKEAQFIDHFTLEVTGDGVSKDCPPVDATVRVGLQDTVRDRVSGMTGVCLERLTFLNGCVHFVVQPAAATSGSEKGLLPKSACLAHGRLEVIKAHAERATQDKITPTRTGGPNRSVRSITG